MIFAQLPSAPSGWEGWTSDTALIFMAVTGFFTLGGMAWFFAKENAKMLSVVRDLDEKREKESRRWRAHNRKQTEVIITRITDKMDERHSDLVKTLFAITGHQTGNNKGAKRTGDGTAQQ